MQLLSFLLPLAAAMGALAGPISQRGQWSEKDLETRGKSSQSSAQSAFFPTPIIGCMLPFQAQAIVTAFNYLLANPQAPNFNSTANALLADDFTDTSDSINQLAGIPEGSVTFSSKQAFIAGSGSQPPLYLQTLDQFNSCNKISWRWISISGTGDNDEKVKGIDNFYINQKGQIEATYAEFNSGAWLADLGLPAVIDN